MKNRQYAAILLVIVMALVFSACGSGTGGNKAAEKESSETPAGADSEDAPAAGDYKTFSDLFAVESDDTMQSVTEDKIVYVVTIDGVATRYEGAGTAEIYKAVDEIPFDAEDRDARIQEIVGPVEITRADVLPAAPSQEELDSLVGKTGQELMDAGYVFASSYVDDEVTIVTAAKDYGSYMFNFDGAIDDESPEWTDEVAKLTSTSADYCGIDYSAIDSFEY